MCAYPTPRIIISLVKSKFSVGHSLAHITLNPRNARGHVRLKNHLPHAVEMDFITFGCSGAGLDCYRPPAFSIALIIIFLASSPERLVTVRCATDCRRRVLVFVSSEISLICMAIRGALRSTILISRSRPFSLATCHLQSIYLYLMKITTS